MKAENFRYPTSATRAIDNFISLWQKSRRNFLFRSGNEIRSLYSAFGKNAFLVTAFHYDNTYYHSEMIAGSLIVIYDHIAYYFYAATSPLGKKLAAPSLIVWEAIKLARNKGCKVFDFEGIYDARFPNKSWLGFTHFKKNFGGKEVEHPGCFTKYYNQLARIFI